MMEKVRVIVDLAEIHYKPVPARSPDGRQADNSALNALKPVWPDTGPTSSVSATAVTS